MSRPCSCCISPHRAQIDAGLVARVPAVTLARQFGVTDDAIGRHRAHLPRASAAQDGARGDALLIQVKQLHQKAIALLLAAERSGDLRGALTGIREAARTLELVGKLEGQIGQGDTTINIVGNPVFLNLQQTIMLALEAHPEARQAVVIALGRQALIEG